MKRVISRKTFAIAFAVASILGATSAAWAGEPHGCSAASLKGGFGFTSTGTLLAVPTPFVGPFGEAGRQTFDGHGHTEGAATLSANGNIVPVTFDGTYTINADCTGSMAVFILPFGSWTNLSFVIDDDGTQVRAIVTDQGFVETRTYTKQLSRRHDE